MLGCDFHNYYSVFGQNGLFKGKIGRFDCFKVVAEIKGYDIIRHWISLSHSSNG